MDDLQGAVEARQSRLGEGLVGREAFREQICLEVAPAALPQAARALRDEWAFDFLAGLTASDAWPVEPRFSLIYVLYSVPHNVFLRPPRPAPHPAAVRLGRPPSAQGPSARLRRSPIQLQLRRDRQAKAVRARVTLRMSVPRPHPPNPPPRPPAWVGSARGGGGGG